LMFKCAVDLAATIEWNRQASPFYVEDSAIEE